ncbi:flagellar biosynthesis anti-sigma factor FlgM [Desnuesiella massiliensis]|uniref:flagellar biosynthesis anti-sigma factor FlgM n=1 Tax=Desnuesiella massiliensis TaxID=1650662 RepID=UPI0006E28122|nr:flagellar biosynthesis anti-sigma factor FlgM [Desnuesiella massiliensis]
MNIKGVNASNVLKVYSDKKVKNTEVKAVKESKDSIEISALGKSLSGYNFDTPNVNNAEKLQRIREQVSNGTYKPNAQLVAKKMVDMIKGREF